MNTFQSLMAVVVLIYALCVIVQAVQEFIIKAWRDSKPATLRTTLATFIGKAAVPELEKVLTSRGLDITALEGLNKDSFKDLLDAIPNAESSLAGLVASAQNRVDKAVGTLDAIQAKFAAAYAKHNKLWVLGLSAVLVLALNANVFFLYENLSSDQTMSQQIASTADKLVHASAAGNQPAQGPGLCKPQPSASTDPTEDYKATRQCVQSLLKEYPTLVRWAPHHKALGGWFAQLKNDAGNSVWKTVFGLVLMCLLVSLGAPFWNDVLKGMTGVNNALNTGGKSS